MKQSTRHIMATPTQRRLHASRIRLSKAAYHVHRLLQASGRAVSLDAG